MCKVLWVIAGKFLFFCILYIYKICKSANEQNFREESPDSIGSECQLMAGRSNPTESATENIPLKIQ